MDESNILSVIGVMFIILGVIFLALPYLGRYVNLERIPWIILWVYRRDGFTFATSLILLIISVVSLILAYLRR